MTGDPLTPKTSTIRNSLSSERIRKSPFAILGFGFDSNAIASVCATGTPSRNCVASLCGIPEVSGWIIQVTSSKKGKTTLRPSSDPQIQKRISEQSIRFLCVLVEFGSAPIYPVGARSPRLNLIVIGNHTPVRIPRHPNLPTLRTHSSKREFPTCLCF